MTDKDARVAEIIGYTLWEEQRGKYLMQYVFRPGIDANAKYKNSNYKQLDWNEYKLGNVEVKEPKFISAPTFATDGIVLKWVQGQDEELQNEWGNSFIAIIWTRRGKTTALSAKWVLHYKPGDYARALLEVNDG